MIQYVSPVPWHDPQPSYNPHVIPKVPGVPVIPPLPPHNPQKYSAQCGECGLLIPSGPWGYVCPNGRCPVQPKVWC